MPINIRKQFAGVGLASGGGAFAPAPVPSGDLETTQALGGANLRRFDTLARAIDGETRAQVEQGEALTGLGESIQAGSHRLAKSLVGLEERRRQSRERHEAATARVQYLRDADTILQRALTETDPAATDLVPRVRQNLHDHTNKLLGELQIRDEGLKSSLEDQMAFISARTTLAARKIGVRQESHFLRGELDKRLAAMHHQALQHRGALQEQLIAVGISDVRDAAAEGLLDGVTAEAKIAAFRTGITRGTIATDALSDPAGSLSRLEAGTYDHLFATEAERAAAADTMGRALTTQRAADLAKLDAMVDGHIASLRSTGRGNPGLRATVAELKPEALEQFDARAGRARLFADVAGRMRFLPRDEAEALVRDSAPSPEAADFERQSQLHEVAREAWHERERALRDDPVAYAAQHPQVTSRADNAALQKVLGVRQPLEMSRSEVAAWQQELEGAEPGKAIELLDRFGGEFSQTGAGQLSTALRDAQPALSLAVHHARSMPDVSKDVLNGLGALRENLGLRPDVPDIEARLEAVFGDAFEFSEHLRRPILEAATAIYARTGRESGAPFDPAAFDAALRRIGGAVMDAGGTMKGGPFEQRGHMILPPRPGLGATETGAAIGALTPGALETYGNGVPLDVLQLPYIPDDIREHGELIPVGMGRYMLRFDDLGGLDDEDSLDGRVGGEGEDPLISRIGDDELLELASLLDDAGVDEATLGELQSEVVQSVATDRPGGAPVLVVAQVIALVLQQIAKTAPNVLRLITTPAGRAAAGRAIGKLIKGSRKNAQEELGKETRRAARDIAIGAGTPAAIEALAPNTPSDELPKPSEEADKGQPKETTRGPSERGTGRFRQMPSAVELRELPLDDPHFVQTVDGGRFVAGPDGSADLIRLPKLKNEDALGVRLARRDLTHVSNDLHDAEARSFGFGDGFEMMLDSLDEWTEIRRGHGNRIVLIRPAERVVVVDGVPRRDLNSVVITELRRLPNEAFWRIPSAGVRKDQQVKDMDLIYKRD